MPGALDGIKVLEVTQIIAGPFAGVLLSDMGADVVKIEPPTGDAMRVLGQFAPNESKGFHAFNRGKRGMVVNLASDDGQAIVHRMIPDFDVFLINARPGVPERIGVDYDTLHALNPKLVYLENTAYGPDGPSAHRAGADIIAQAYSGLMAGDEKVDEHGGPDLITATTPADFSAAWISAMAVCAALYHRERTGEGQKIDTSLLGGALDAAERLRDAATRGRRGHPAADSRSPERDPLTGRLVSRDGRRARRPALAGGRRVHALLRRLRDLGRGDHAGLRHARQPSTGARRDRPHGGPDFGARL